MGQTDRRTDGRTLDICMDSAPHTMRAVSTIINFNQCQRTSKGGALEGLQYSRGSGDGSPPVGSRGRAPVGAEDVLRNNVIMMHSGERFKAFTIHTVTCRYAVTVRRYVEDQPQK